MKQIPVSRGVYRCKKEYFYPMNKWWVIITAFVLIQACGVKPTDIKKFYFPYPEFIHPKVYVYSSADGDSVNTTYWSFKTFVQESDTFFTTTVFDKNLKPNTIYVNYIKPDGAYLQKMIYIVQDTIQLTYLVEQNEVYKWKIKKDQKLTMFMTLTMDAASQEIFSERSFEKKLVEKDWMGKTCQTLMVIDKMNISLMKDNRTSTEERYKTGYFVEGVGLVEFTTAMPDGTEEHFKLEKILSEKDWVELIQNNGSDSLSIIAN